MSGRTIDSDWQRVTDNKGQRVVQQMTTTGTSGTTIDTEWQRVTTNDNEWQQMTMSNSDWQKVIQRVKTAQYTSKNGWLRFFL